MARLVEQVHHRLMESLQVGDVAIDATVGNGHDTLFLARAVGESGRVYGFDIQRQALDSTGRRLDEAALAGRVSLYHAGHETLCIQLAPSLHGRVKAIVFNLGYLPGGDKQRTTSTATTLAALQQALLFLAPGGILSVLAYTGHPGGREEATAVRQWVSALACPPWVRELPSSAETGEGMPQWFRIVREEKGG